MGKFLIMLLWLAGFIWGGVGVVERLLIGKKLLNLGSYVSWGLWVSLYIYLIGLSSGAYIFACLVSVFKLKSFSRLKQVSLLASLVTLLGGLLTIVLDLGHWERFWYVFIHPGAFFNDELDGLDLQPLFFDYPGPDVLCLKRIAKGLQFNIPV